MSKSKVAVVGASGFVGSALCERLYFRREADLVPLIHSSGNAARLSRLPIELRSVNLLKRDELTAALSDVDVVVNCSRGDNRVMLDGLRHMIAAARAAGVRKFIHISSLLIYGEDPHEESATEAAAVRPGANEYGRMKVKQDEMVFALHRAGIPSYILCPGNIGGPYSFFILGLAHLIGQHPIPLVDNGRYATNLVHVDNLVEAIVTAVHSDRGAGERYFVNDEQIDWKRLFEDLATVLGVRLETVPATREEILRRINRPKPSSGLGAHVRIAMSGEFRRGLSMLPVMAGLNRMAKGAFDSLPDGFQQRMRERVQEARKIVGSGGGVPLDDGFVRVQARRVYHSPKKIEESLGYRPLLTYERGLETTAAWLRHFGLVRKRNPVVAG